MHELVPLHHTSPEPALSLWDQSYTGHPTATTERLTGKREYLKNAGMAITTAITDVNFG